MSETLRDRWKYMRINGYVRGSVVWPVVLAVLFIVVFALAFHATGQYDVDDPTDVGGGSSTNTSSSFFQRLWATLGMFTGAYISLSPKWDPMPPPWLSAVAVAAFLWTLMTAGSLVLLSKRTRDYLLTLRPRAALVIIGDGGTAAALVKSSIKHGKRTILVTDSRNSVSALATKPSIPIIAAGQIDSAIRTPSVRRVIKNAGHVVVATDDDGRNMQLYRTLHDVRHEQNDESKSADPKDLSSPQDLVVIHDSEYAESLHPKVIRDQLPSAEVTCPAENIAEHVCHLIIAAVTAANVRRAAVEIKQIGDEDDPLTATLRTWARRLSWSLRFVEGKRETLNGPAALVPNISLAGESDGMADLRIEVLTGAEPTAVAAAALGDPAPPRLQIAVTNGYLVTHAGLLAHTATDHGRHIALGRDWLVAGNGSTETPTLLAVDREAVGLDANLVTDDTGTQWARTFDLTYGLMFSTGEYPVTGWQPGAAMGDSASQAVKQAIAAGEPAERVLKSITSRSSSKDAVHHMLKQLTERGFELRTHQVTDAPPPEPDMDPRTDVEYIAAHEHDDWMGRTWLDTSRRRSSQMHSVIAYSGSGAAEHCYLGLVALENTSETLDEPRQAALSADYNRRIATQTYPAIAASFGYRIVRRDNYNPPTGEEAIDYPDCRLSTCAALTKDALPPELAERSRRAHGITEPARCDT